MNPVPLLLPSLAGVGLALALGLAPGPARADLEDCVVETPAPRKAKPSPRKRVPPKAVPTADGSPAATVEPVGRRTDAMRARTAAAHEAGPGAMSEGGARSALRSEPVSMHKMPIDCWPVPVRELRAGLAEPAGAERDPDSAAAPTGSPRAG